VVVVPVDEHDLRLRILELLRRTDAGHTKQDGVEQKPSPFRSEKSGRTPSHLCILAVPQGASVPRSIRSMHKRMN
jgi:hypothetical protein